MPRRSCQGPALSCVRPPRPGSVLPPPPLPPPPPGRAGLGSPEPSGGLGTGPDSSVPPRCVAGCGFIILIDSSCSPTPWGPRPRKGGGGGICGPLPGPSPPAAPRATDSLVPCWSRPSRTRRRASPAFALLVGREGTKERSCVGPGAPDQGASPGPGMLPFVSGACPQQRFCVFSKRILRV